MASDSAHTEDGMADEWADNESDNEQFFEDEWEIDQDTRLNSSEQADKPADGAVGNRSSPDVNIEQNLKRVEDQMHSIFNDITAESRKIRQERDGLKQSIERIRQFVEEKMKRHGHGQRRKLEFVPDENHHDLLKEVEALIDLERNEILKAKDECEVKWKTETAKCQKEVNKLREKTDKLESARKEKEAKFVAENKERKRLEKELKDRQKKYDDQLSVNTDLAKKQICLQELNQKLEVDLKNGHSNLSQAIYRLRDREERITEQQKKMEELLNQNQSLYQKIDRLSSQLQSSQNKVVELEKSITLLEIEKSKLNLRLSKLAGAHLTRDSPNIADLSDENRPTKLAEKYSELYDNEWTNAFIELLDNWKLSERASADEMIRLLKATNYECMRLSKPHREVIKHLQAVTIQFKQLSTRNKLMQTQENMRSPKSSSVDQLISSNVAKDINEEFVSAKLKVEVEEEVNTNPYLISKYNEEGPFDSTETTDEKGLHSREHKHVQKTVVLSEEISGRRQYGDAFKTDVFRKESGNEEHIDNNANNPSDIAATKGEKETDEEELDKGNESTFMRREVVKNDTLDATGDQEGVGVVTAEIHIKVYFTAEQKKTMKTICTTKMDQDKTIAEVIAQKVASNFKNDYLSNEAVMTYIKKCAELCWYMPIQEPPVVIGFENMNDDVLFDKDKYNAYTKTGKILDFVVWPPLYLDEGGPMLFKGIAQGK